MPQESFVTTAFSKLPDNLPVPENDGACSHLLGMMLPSVGLPSTDGSIVNLATVAGYVVIYCYPMTGRPGQALPDGWDQIPGARGCTPQSCSFRDHYQELKELGSTVFGLSVQSTDYQKEAVTRLHLPFMLLSDEAMVFVNALSLPTFEVDGKKLIRRITMIANEGRIIKIFYPVFPPDKNPNQIIDWLKGSAA